MKYEIKTRKVIETFYEIEAENLDDAKQTTFTRSDKVNSITYEPYVIHTREFYMQESNVGTDDFPILSTNRKYTKEYNHITEQLTLFECDNKSIVH